MAKTIGKRAVPVILILILVLSLASTALAAQPLTEQYAYETIIAMKNQYPEGMPWTNADTYDWPPGIWIPANPAPNTVYYFTGGGCVAFAMIMSDAVFGKLPVIEHNDLSRLRVGDIVRENDNRWYAHSYIVLEVHPEHIIIAEGNYNSSVHWGRKIMLSDLQKVISYIWTRYPGGEPAPMPMPGLPVNDPPDEEFQKPVPLPEQTDSLAAFVTRLYNLCLGRDPEKFGFDIWVARLESGLWTGSEVAYDFIFSIELENKKLSNPDFTEVLYNALMGRPSDPLGKEAWVHRLSSGYTKEDVFYGFVSSPEFAGICARYGITP